MRLTGLRSAMPSFVVLTPSRGLVHSRTVEAVEANRTAARNAGHTDHGWRLVHGEPIPDCDNDAVEAGLATNATALLFVEEDMVPPADALLRAFETLRDNDVAAVDYPVGEHPAWACISRNKGAIEWCGLGFTLIRRTLFEQLDRPWFRTDITYAIDRDADGSRSLREMHRPSEYGGQDIHFFRRSIAAGARIGQVPGIVAGHAKVREMGRSGTNNGAHRIEVLTRIEREQWA